MPPNNVKALHEGLRQLLAEGLNNRLRRFQKLADYLRQGLKELGMPLVVPDDIASAVMTVAWGPPGVPTSQLVRYVEVEHGIKIAGGLGAFKDKVIRIGHMSPKVTTAHMDQLLAALKDFIQKQKAPS
jgi:aspartate aminotransferase-like enzyme